MRIDPEMLFPPPFLNGLIPPPPPLALHHQIAPPTINTNTIDSAFPSTLDVIPGVARAMPMQHAISNAFAFGGNIATVIFSRAQAGT